MHGRLGQQRAGRWIHPEPLVAGHSSQNRTRARAMVSQARGSGFVGEARAMDTKVGPVLQDLLIEGSRERGYRCAGEHFYTWQPERAETRSWVEELSPFDRHEKASPPAAPR